MDWIYRHKVIIGIISLMTLFFLPLIINELSQIPSTYTILHAPSAWLSFWGSYIAAIASMGMIFVTALSIYKNDKQQIRALKYQSKLEWINQLKGALVEVVNCFDENIINEFYNEFKSNLEHPNFSNILITAENRIRHATFSVDTLLMGCTDTIASEFMDAFREKKITFQIYLDEICFVLQFKDRFLNSEGLSNTEYFKKQLEIFKKNTPHFKDKPNPDRIWEIAEDFEYKLISRREEILNRMLSCANSYFFRKACAKFVNEELNIADSILYGTETK